MNRREARNAIQQLRQQGRRVEALGTELLGAAQLRYENPGGVVVVGAPDYLWVALDEETRQIQRDALDTYQRWYSLGLKLVENYMPARLEEFNNRYQNPMRSRNTVMGWLQLRVRPFSGRNEDAVQAFIDAFDVQRGIVEGIATTVKNSGPTVYEYTSPVYWFHCLKEQVSPWLSQAWGWLQNHPISWVIGGIFTLLATDWFVLGQNVRMLVRRLWSLVKAIL